MTKEQFVFERLKREGLPIDRKRKWLPAVYAQLEAENIDLKDKAAYWEAKAMEYKALLENMERVG